VRRPRPEPLPTVELPDGRVWLRVADPAWDDPLDPVPPGLSGGRWNAPGAYPTLYFSADPLTARAQLERLLADAPVDVEDLEDDAYVLVAARLPRDQRCADATDPRGLKALRLPLAYPLDDRGEPVPHAPCQRAGRRVHEADLRGVWARSAASAHPERRELAWFPAAARSRARPVWRRPRPLGRWRDATEWADLRLPPQRAPRPVR